MVKECVVKGWRERKGCKINERRCRAGHGQIDAYGLYLLEYACLGQERIISRRPLLRHGAFLQRQQTPAYDTAARSS